MNEVINNIMLFLFLPATWYGAGGAIIRTRHGGKTVQQLFLNLVEGILVAHIFTPVVLEYVPEAWHLIGFFILGRGGLELIDPLYETVKKIFEIKLKDFLSIKNEEYKDNKNNKN